MRTCPRCKTWLTQIFNGEVELDHCRKCRGNFFDVGKAAASFGPAAEPESWVASHCAFVKGESSLPCPAGHGALIAYDLSFSDEHVEVDACRTCRGLWLDAGEGGRLERIVSGFDQAAADAEQSSGAKRYWFMLFTGFPVEVFHPVRRRPRALFGLVALLFAVFAAEAVVFASRPESVEAMLRVYGIVPAQFMAGQQWWTLATHAFLHASALHLLSNLYSLWIFGDNVEDHLGSGRFLVIYGLAGLAGGLLHLAMLPDTTLPMVGASGAISGIMAAYWLLFPKARVWMVLFFVRFRIPVPVYLGGWLVLQVAGAASGVGSVAWYAHLGGFVAGLGAALWLRPRGLTRSPARAPGAAAPTRG